MSITIDKKSSKFFKELPYKEAPYSKKNWGNPNHSLCSYQGKLKPALAYHLVKTFVPAGGTVFDPFAGVGTIPFEGALNGRHAYGMDISPLAYIVSNAKLHRNNRDTCLMYIRQLEDYILNTNIAQAYFENNAIFGFNKSLQEYYHPETFGEILKARVFVHEHFPETSEEMLVVSSLLHILHGNRPYALSRRSHPIVPYAPSGDFEYKNLIEKLTEKVEKSVSVELPTNFVEGEVFFSDSTKKWSDEIKDLDAIITSPPFFDSTRFYLANWIRLWFLGWDDNDFDTKPSEFVDEKQKASFNVYDSIFTQAKERLKNDGYFVMHLGKSKKCDMGEVLQTKARHWFNHARLYSESVDDIETFGIKDLGTVATHQYLIMH